MTSLKMLFAATIFLSALTSHADILFLDINNNPKEIATAQKAANLRHERLIVLPDQNTISKNEKQLRDKYEAASTAAAKACEAKDPINCPKLMEERGKILKKVKDSPSFLNKTKLSAELAKLKSQGVKLSSLVVSGHDGNGQFAGSQGSMDDKSIAESFKSAEPVGDSIRSMMLWGCYTVNIGSLSSYWKKALPNVELIAGYDGIAPLGDKPANWDYLSDVLVKEKSLTAIKDANELKTALNGLNGTNIVNASLCVNDNFASHKFALNLRDASKLCAGALEAVKPVYECYLNATESRCANPPKNTMNSELRAAYNKLQDTKHCIELAGGDATNWPSPDTLIRLIHFQNVKKNFITENPTFTTQMNELLKKVGTPPDLYIGDLSKMNRQDILKQMNALKDYLSERLKKDSPENPELWTLYTAAATMQGTLGDLRVPFDWVEPSTLENSEAMQMANDALTPKGISNSRRQYETGRAYKDMNNKIHELISTNNPKYKADVDSMEQIENEIAKLSSERRPPFDKLSELYQKYSTIQQKVTEISSVETPKILPQLKAAATELAKQPYSNQEGQAVYQKYLQEFITDKSRPKSEKTK